MIAESHPLQQLFTEMVRRNYSAPGVELNNPELCAYVANMLCEFCDAEQLYKIRDAEGRPLNDVGEMMLESDPVFGDAPSFDRERQVRKQAAALLPESTVCAAFHHVSAVLLASPEASYITGALIPVTGGRPML